MCHSQVGNRAMCIQLTRLFLQGRKQVTSQGYLKIIQTFGRFPKRNAALGRDSTPEEVEYMASRRGGHAERAWHLSPARAQAAAGPAVRPRCCPPRGAALPTALRLPGTVTSRGTPGAQRGTAPRPPVDALLQPLTKNPTGMPKSIRFGCFAMHMLRAREK